MAEQTNLTPNAEKNKTAEKDPVISFAAKEAYNLLRTNIEFSFPDSEEGKVIGITSPCPHEGKSFTAMNLAISLAEAGNTVLLIDCDMRRPTLAEKLNKPSTPGLSNLLVANEKNVIHTGVASQSLSFIASGDLPPNPSELLGSDNMKAVLDLFRSHFDYLILDLPPVNIVSDAIVVSKNIDGLVLVVRHGITKRKDVNEAMRQIKMCGVRLLGFVYNGQRPKGSALGGKYYKKYRSYGNYYYGSEAGSSSGKGKK